MINLLNFHENGQNAIAICSIPRIVSEDYLKFMDQFGFNDPFLFGKKIFRQYTC